MEDSSVHVDRKCPNTLYPSCLFGGLSEGDSITRQRKQARALFR